MSDDQVAREIDEDYAQEKFFVPRSEENRRTYVRTTALDYAVRLGTIGTARDLVAAAQMIEDYLLGKDPEIRVARQHSGGQVRFGPNVPFEVIPDPGQAAGKFDPVVPYQTSNETVPAPEHGAGEVVSPSGNLTPEQAGYGQGSDRIPGRAGGLED